MSKKKRPIWTPQQVQQLNQHQKNENFHPYTCPGDYAACDIERNLIATPFGWVCHCGKYTQNWAHMPKDATARAAMEALETQKSPPP